MRPLLLSILCAIATLATPPSNADTTLPNGWVVYPTPEPKSCDWLRANYSKREWRVRLDAERLVIEPDDRASPRRTKTPRFVFPTNQLTHALPQSDDRVLQIDKGWLVGFDHGEWGGQLWWADESGRNAYAVPHVGSCAGIADTGPEPTFRATNVRSLLRSGKNAFVITGLAHLGLHDGEFSRLDYRGGKWQSCLLRNLEGAASAVTPDGPESWFVLTRALMRVHANGTLDKIRPLTFLARGLYPNSMIKLPDGTLYVGMRHFVARLTPNGQGGYRDQLLIPAGRPAFDHEPMIDDASDHSPGFPNCSHPN